ncbi:prepilin-type N-terminal cleavage/methylation domain-containing protein [Eubacterium sp. AM46-8]|uniref:PilW family protein n=1 Tax=Eubacterium sp. AM46-8 TaxID=2292350 RepID=UPI000E497828|nr:prepilin-type N-terminal cleavage/methylation domain-containing protein [Eubacterium sp. AM46-8]RGZ90410.1 prepilin-type N-terminal cleavage/methylation domain-containing protein [Eubacterium sp. AM46-8]
MKEDNKGFSLVELLIAIAISGIVLTALVLLITQSVKSYGRQTALAQIQSDADISLNQIQKNVMEANEIKVKKSVKSSGLIDVELYTTRTTEEQIDASGNKKTVTLSEWGYYYDSEKKELYYSDDTLNPDQMSLVCDNVSHFDVIINEDGIKWDNAKITSIVKKPQIIVSITISRMGRERTVVRQYSTRNTINSGDGSFQIGKSISGDVDTEKELTMLTVGIEITPAQKNCYFGKQ